MLYHHRRALVASPSLLLFALPLALADVQFTTPATGAHVPVGLINVAWKDSGKLPAIGDLTVYTLALMVGGNEPWNSLQIATLVSNGNFTTNTASGTIEAGIAPTIENGFYLKITSNDVDSGQVVNYSSRFTVTGLTGTIRSVYRNAVTALNGNTAGPPRSGNVPALTSASSAPTLTKTGAGGSKNTVTVTADAKSQASSSYTPATPPYSGSSGPSTAEIAIIVVVLVLFFASMGLAGYLLLRRRRRRQQQQQQQWQDSPDVAMKAVAKQDSVTSLSELSAESKVNELGDGLPPPEMDSNSVRAELEGSPVVWRPETPEEQHAFGTGTWGGTNPLTPVAPSISEETLDGSIDYMASPVTPLSRI